MGRLLTRGVGWWLWLSFSTPRAGGRTRLGLSTRFTQSERHERWLVHRCDPVNLLWLPRPKIHPALINPWQKGNFAFPAIVSVVCMHVPSLVLWPLVLGQCCTLLSLSTYDTHYGPDVTSFIHIKGFMSVPSKILWHRIPRPGSGQEPWNKHPHWSRSLVMVAISPLVQQFTTYFKDYHLSPPRLFTVKNTFYCFMRPTILTCQY